MEQINLKSHFMYNGNNIVNWNCCMCSGTKKMTQRETPLMYIVCIEIYSVICSTKLKCIISGSDTVIRLKWWGHENWTHVLTLWTMFCKTSFQTWISILLVCQSHVWCYHMILKYHNVLARNAKTGIQISCDFLSFHHFCVGLEFRVSVLFMSVSGLSSHQFCHSNKDKVWLLGMFAKLQRPIISFVLYAQPSDHTEHLGSHWTDFQAISYLNVF